MAPKKPWERFSKYVGVDEVGETSMFILVRKRIFMSLSFKKIELVIIALALLAPTSATAQEVTANAGYVSQYFYRGISQKTSSATTGVDVGFGALSVGTWLADVGDGAEVDVYSSLGVDVSGLRLSAGGTAYLYTGQFDDTYKEVNLGAGYGPLSVEFSFGQYDNFGAGIQDYWFTAVTAENEGAYATYGTFGNAFDGSYGEVGYGFSAAELDFTVSGILSDSELSGLSGRDNAPTPGLAVVFGINKTFGLNQ